ncbi:hypothetical protein BJY01DRAFT_131768 [Aspergillus pseudoustus]|uniref:GATA-type domain-containing protein n=1 Tax=Aspergillus pseudoustus TaxID=1810923 RepID=A0ABR4IKR3_9EURO
MRRSSNLRIGWKSSYAAARYIPGGKGNLCRACGKGIQEQEEGPMVKRRKPGGTASPKTIEGFDRDSLMRAIGVSSEIDWLRNLIGELKNRDSPDSPNAMIPISEASYHLDYSDLPSPGTSDSFPGHHTRSLAGYSTDTWSRSTSPSQLSISNPSGVNSRPITQNPNLHPKKVLLGLSQTSGSLFSI